MARQVLTNTNLHGFNVARQLPKVEDFSTFGYFVSNANYTSSAIDSPATSRFYGNFDLGNSHPFRTTFICSFARWPIEAGTARTYASIPVIYFPSADPNSPRNDESRFYTFNVIENVFTVSETISTAATMIRTPYGNSANIYSRIEQWFASGGDVTVPAFGTIYDVFEAIVSTTYNFETANVLTVYHMRDMDLYTRFTHRGNNAASSVTFPSGSFVVVYSVAFNTSTADWSSFFNGINSTNYDYRTLNNSDSSAFVDGSDSYSTSLAWASINSESVAVDYIPTWSGNPYQFTVAYVYN